MLSILLIEDENLAARRLEKMIARIFEGVDYKLVHCACPESGEIEIKKNPDLLLLDLNLGVMNAMDWVREHKLCPEKTIIISADTRYADEAYSLGICGYVFKPVDEATLKQQIHHFLGSCGKAI